MDSEFLHRISTWSPKRLALLAAQLKEQVDENARLAHEPLAIVGVGCRFPGSGSGVDAFWSLLDEGRDAVCEVPLERWDIDAFYDPDPDAPGRISTRSGGFLHRIGEFDAAFFGITPREALTLDPQQRLLLEVTWEALEHAGLSPAELFGSTAGVFVGICNSDHFQRVLGRGLESIDAYIASGNAHSTAAGRLSYFLGLQGPALSIDTACSSSLVALHIACQSLRRGETPLVIVGGVNLMCSPETTVALTKAHMLAPDGRCKTFDAKADGFSRGEGCGVLVLKRLSDATAAGNRVLAVIRGSAVNQDGRSSGLTVPNGPAQETVIRAALADAGVSPADVSYVEAHGTGTSLGDPIEVRALAGAFSPGRSKDQPLLIGSVKTNFGHLESAAGLAGVIKVALALVHERIPKHLHFHEPSPHIDWARYPVAVTAEARAWARSDRPRIAGVSSFGFSGTNAHVIIEEAPTPPVSPTPPARPLHVLPLSARTPAALRELGDRCAAALASPSIRLADAAFTAGAGRSHFNERLAIVAGTTEEARVALAAFHDGATHPALHRGVAASGGPLEVVFMYTGQGSQYPGMGRFLYEHAPVFRDVIERCSKILGPDAQGRTLEAVLAPGPSEGAPIHDTAWTQPALFALEYGITELWRSFGVEPAAVIGHSVGEYVAACVAGVFTLEEGLTLIAERGRLLQALPPGGAMAAIFAPHDEVAAAVRPLASRLAVAAINAPDSVVVAGTAQAVDSLLSDFARRNIEGRRLLVSFAAHSPLVEPAMDALEGYARKVEFRAPKIPVAWNVTGGAPLPGGAPDAGYFRRHLREPVRFAEGMASLLSYRAFLEVGPHPVLTALAQRGLPEEGHGRLFLSSLRRGKDDASELAGALAELYANGAKIDFAGVDHPFGGRRISWPSYPFERRTYWLPLTASTKTAGPAWLPVTSGALPGARLPTAATIFELTLKPDSLPYLASHRAFGQVLVAAPVLVEIAQAVAARSIGKGRFAVADFVVREPVVLTEQGRTLQTELEPERDGSYRFSIHGRSADSSDDWRLHAEGRLDATGGLAKAALAPIAELETRLGSPASSDAFYAQLSALGVELGGAFRAIEEARVRQGEALALVTLPASHAADEVSFAHPGLLDGSLQAVGMALASRAEAADVYLFSEFERLELAKPLPTTFLCHARLRATAESRPLAWYGDVTLRALDGELLGAITGVCLRRTSSAGLARLVGGAAASGLYYGVDWEPVPIVEAGAPWFVDPTRWSAPIRTRFSALAREHQLSVYDEILPELDRLSALYIAHALRALGFEQTLGRRFESAAEAQALGVVPRHARLFTRSLEILAEDGVLRALGAGAFEVKAPLPSIEPTPHLRPALAEYDGELSVLGRAGPHLARVLRAEQDPIELLFPGGTFAEAHKIYVQSPFARTYNAALTEALVKAIAELPQNARLRVLEIGAGTGGTTTYVLPALPSDRVEYTFTDVSPLFLDRAREQFGRHAFLTRALLDIERDPLGQGFLSGAYDIVIAANVLHATANLSEVLANVRKLLAPAGMLFLLEGTAPERWVDLTFGLTEGWWRFTDADLRPSYPLINREAWSKLLEEQRFSRVTLIPDVVDGRAAQQALIVARGPERPSNFVIVGGLEALAKSLAERLNRGQHSAILLAADTTTDVDPESDIVYLGALELERAEHDDLDAPRRSESLACALPLAWLARSVRANRGGRVWFVTRGAVRVQGESVEAPEWQAPLWGLARGFALEQPARFGAIIDLPVTGTAAELAALLSTELDTRRRVTDDEDQIAWRGGRRFGARLVPKAAPTPAKVAFRADATYLVTGGYGGLGLVVARWLAEHGAKFIALAGRHPDPASEAVRAIEQLGVRVIPVALDVGDDASVAALAALLAGSADFPALGGVVHAAADLSEAPIGVLDAEQVARMLRPKLRGSVLLERSLRAAKLDFFALFSSTTALFGASGLAHYAAANAFLDALAESARKRGVRAVSINWGTWETMRLASGEDQKSFREGGLLPLSTTEALDALGRLLVGSEPRAVVANIEWSLLKPLHEARRKRRFLARVGGVPISTQQVTPVTGPPPLQARLAAVPPAMRREVLLDFVLAEVSTVLQVGGSEPLALDTGLFELGMDSLMSVELRKRLERGAGRPLPSTLTFNYPSVNALVGFFELELSGAPPAPSSPPVAAAPAAPPAPTTSNDLDLLSDDELAARLRARLERTR